MRFCDRQSLALLMRVSPDFLERARPLFYEVLCFTHPLDVAHLIRTPLALSFLRSLTAHMGAELLQLPALPNLHTLSWTHDAWPGHEKPLIARSVRAFLPRFHSLRHLALSLSLLTVPSLDFVLAPISTRLLSLKVVCVVHGHMDRCRARPRSRFSNLRLLCVDDPRYGELSGSAFSCLTRGNHCLQTIRFPRDTTWASIQTALGHSPSSVSSLEFEGSPPLVRLSLTYGAGAYSRSLNWSNVSRHLAMAATSVALFSYRSGTVSKFARLERDVGFFRPDLWCAFGPLIGSRHRDC